MKINEEGSQRGDRDIPRREQEDTNNLVDLFDGRHRVVEHLSLRIVIRELWSESFDLESVDGSLGVSVSSLFLGDGVGTGKK